MSDLIPTITIMELKTIINTMEANELKELSSFEVMSDGKYLWTIISAPASGDLDIRDSIKTTADYLGLRANSVGGISPIIVADVAEEPNTCPECSFVARSKAGLLAHQRIKHKELVPV